MLHHQLLDPLSDPATFGGDPADAFDVVVGGDVESVFSKDTLLTNLMFYWAPNSVSSAIRIYYESDHDEPRNFGFPKPEVPVGFAVFPGDPFNLLRSWAERNYNVVRWTEMPRGGHFAALEEPELLCEDVRAFFRRVR